MTTDRYTCPACWRQVQADLVAPSEAIAASIKPLLTVNSRGWEPGKGLCRECLSRFLRVHERLAAAYPEFAEQERKIIPTSMRVDAPERYRGRGVTIAFIDAGFYAHPDLVRPRNRILRYVSVTDRARLSDLAAPKPSSWHGMMTSVVAAGNGFLSAGLYRGIASEADLVLVKAGTAARIRHGDIEAALRWVVRHKDRYNTRVVNISCGGDHQGSYLADNLSQAAEDATRAGLVVVAAAGNAGHSSNHSVLPPASAPSVITVGGLDDKNNLEFDDNEMYRSSYGPTIDGLQKPEVIAPGIWIAAPILPRTPTAGQAVLLSKLEHASDVEARRIIMDHAGVDEDLDGAANLAPYLLRNLVWMKIRDNKVISGHYKHVDGTSFAAPIVSSVAAQILEAVPDLRPWEVKLALIKTAMRIPNVPVDQQGWGVVNPRAAITAAIAMRAADVRTREADHDQRPR